jgi:predicted MFS family arabinose efflux permease
MFVIMTIADMFRPAMFVSRYICKARKPYQSLARSVQFGFTAGPALGGLIIMNLGYSGLFWVMEARASSRFWFYIAC